MNITVKPKKLSGAVTLPSSKSLSHRLLIAAALSDGISSISGVSRSEDIDATTAALETLGAKISSKGSVYEIKGIGQAPTGGSPVKIDCGESGSTLRFLIPIAAALGIDAEFSGRGRLPERPVTPYLEEMSKKGIKFTPEKGGLPLSVSGRLSGGEYSLRGDMSSQFITGLLFALPLCGGDCEINLTSPLESKPYADMTVSALELFGIHITEEISENGFLSYKIKGGQKYRACAARAEGDYSQAAFYFAANALGSNIEIKNLNKNSLQGDKKIIEILDNIGYNSGIFPYKSFSVSASDIPDLVPALAVIGSFTDGVSRITNAGRLRIKECDRLEATASVINSIGGKVKAFDDSLEIYPVKSFKGGVVNDFNDHRIVMAAAIASCMSDGEITINGADAVNKSYPDFWKDFSSLGGIWIQTQNN